MVKQKRWLRIRAGINGGGIVSELHITANHTGKMKGMASISTSREVNPNCQAYAKIEGSVCSKCYAARQLAMFKNLREVLERNYNLLTERVLDESKLPLLNYGFFWIEAFGDLANVTHATNYLNLIRKNQQTFFGWWTKNPEYIKMALKEHKIKKPKNCNIILSSLFINEEQENRYDFVDKVFTVYDKNYIKENKININCGGRSCLECHKCYEKNRIKFINEKLKWKRW